MARRGRGGGKRGPDLSWDDEEDDPSTFSTPNRPAPQFPDITLPVPRPISTVELSRVKSYLRFRDRAHNGPYYSVLDPSSLADAKTGKVIKRAGFDPFNDQEKYTAKYYKKKRTVPDLSGRDYELRYFPTELWPLLDPRRKHALWKSTDIDFDAETDAPRKKRKRDAVVEEEEDVNEDNDQGNDTDGSDPLLSGTRRSRNSTRAAKRRRDDLTTRKAGEKRGLDAEDDFSEEEIQPRPRRNKKDKNKGSDDEDDDEDENDNAADKDDDDDDDDDGSGDDEPVDSEFEESDDGGGDDYNAENYFDTGEGDDEDGFAYGGGRGGDDDGGYF